MFLKWFSSNCTCTSKQAYGSKFSFQLRSALSGQQWKQLIFFWFWFLRSKKHASVSACVLPGENTTHAALYAAAVWLMDRVFFAEGCWLLSVLTKIWLAEPKAYFITHKTFHLLVPCAQPLLFSSVPHSKCWVRLDPLFGKPVPNH